MARQTSGTATTKEPSALERESYLADSVVSFSHLVGLCSAISTTNFSGAPDADGATAAAGTEDERADSFSPGDAAAAGSESGGNVKAGRSVGSGPLDAADMIGEVKRGVSRREHAATRTTK